MKKHNKLIALLLVLALALSLAVPVSAAAETQPRSTQVLKMRNAEKDPATSMILVYPYAQTFSATAIKGSSTLLQFKLTYSLYNDELFYMFICRGSVDEVLSSYEPDVVEERIYEADDFYNNAIGVTWTADSRYSVGEYTLIGVILNADGSLKTQNYYAVDLYVVDHHIPATGMEVAELYMAEFFEVPEEMRLGEYMYIAYSLTPYANTSDRTTKVYTPNPDVLDVRLREGYVYVVCKGFADTSITITCGNISKTIPIKAGRPNLEILWASGENTDLCVGMTDKLSLKTTPYGYPFAVNWESDNTDVVTIQNGIVTAVGPGTANIKVTCLNETATVTYTVHPHELPEGTPVSERTATKPAMAVGPCSCCGNKEAVNIFEKPVFTDTDYKAWYSDHVDYVYDEGIMNGTGEHSFGPDMALSRAMVVTVLYRAAGSPEVTGEIPFADVEEGMWYSDAILWAYQNEVVNGVGDGSRFDPNGNITREQIATILYRYTQSLGVEMAEGADLNTYPDGAMVSAYAEEGMAWAVGEGLITGAVSNGVTTLSPWNTATRAQFATIISRYQQMFPADSE